jgi:transcriptional regulator with XRE-family HTH domain
MSNDPYDAIIGGNIRLARLAAKMSQTDLARKINLTFQQVQKYETGANRVGAGRLLRIANVLDLPVIAFYRDLEQSSRPNPSLPFLQKQDSFRLVEAFDKITNRRVRNTLVALVVNIAERKKTNKRTIRRNGRRK